MVGVHRGDCSREGKELMGSRGEVFSTHITAGKRTYFFNVKENRHGDVFLNLVESKKNGESEFERHSIIVFQEDLDNFLSGFNQAVEFIRKQKL
jgi:hypothetical protein